MKRILCSLALILASNTQAQVIQKQITVVCEKHDVVLNALQNEHKETVIWIGKDKQVVYGVLANNTTKTWTVILTDNNVACIVGTGEGFFVINPI